MTYYDNEENYPQPPIHDVRLDSDQQQALSLIAQGCNVHVSGKAGVGKSYLLHQVKETLSAKNMIFLAPTGLAALSLSGQTIHSFFGFTSSVFARDGIPNPNTLPVELILATETFIIDEISMVRSDLFTAIDNSLRFATGVSRPFGGKQIVVVGDFHQLPPVVGSGMEYSYLKKYFTGPWAFDAESWRQAGFRTVFLNTIHRQSGELEFTSLLNTVRSGDVLQRFYGEDSFGVYSSNCIESFNSCVTIREGYDPSFITLCTTRRDVARINQIGLESLAPKSNCFDADIGGCYDEADLPTEKCLKLKVGARVMVCANAFGCVNGDLGEVVAIDTQEHLVKVRLDSGRLVEVGKQ
jgi:ATP-dependent DNA helicase PIF1